jgi:hypothetical protein
MSGRGTRDRGPGFDGGGGGGGGSGGTVPTPPAAGLVLTSTGSGPGDYDWEPSGGSAITAFSVGTTTAERGQSLASVTYNATANEVPSSATISWSGVASGSQAVTPGTSMSGSVTGPFASSANGATLNWTLTCVFSDGTRTRTATTTWESAVVWAPSSSPSTVTIATLRAANVALKTSNAGSYSATMGAGEYMTWAAPASFAQPPTVLYGVLPVTPVSQQSGVAYTNPFGVSVPMNVWTFGVAGIGAATFDVTS